MTTIATLFTGFGGVEIGAMATGLTPIWGIEYNPKIAAVANKNLGNHVVVADVRHVNPCTLERPDVLHASPVCKNASVASNGSESSGDIETAEAVVGFIETLRPGIFTLENVFPYRHFESFNKITNCLSRAGYMWDYNNVNTADYGVPQTRRRLILRAVHGRLLPQLPPPEKWRGWYEAIEDLIPTLPEAKLAQWQLDRLPEKIKISSLVDSSKTIRDATVYGKDTPAMTISKSLCERPSHLYAILIDGSNGNNFDDNGSLTMRYNDQPANTVKGSASAVHRVLFDNGRVVSLTPRALARLQSIPDWYELPKQRRLASEGIGNAVPPFMMQKILRQLI